MNSNSEVIVDVENKQGIVVKAGDQVITLEELPLNDSLFKKLKDWHRARSEGQAQGQIGDGPPAGP